MMRPDTMVPNTTTSTLRNSPSGSVSSKIQLFENKASSGLVSPEIKPLSPGDFGSPYSSSKKRAPSPGSAVAGGSVYSPLKPISNRIISHDNSNVNSNNANASPSPRYSSSPKKRPSPGGGAGGPNSMVPPSPGGPTMKTPTKPSPEGSKRRQPSPGRSRTSSPQRQRQPSPGRGRTPSPRRRQPSPGGRAKMEQQQPQQQQFVATEPKRFVFSKEPTGVAPSTLNIASQPGMGNVNSNINGNFSPHQNQSLGMKNQNPVRNNPQFLQRMTEAIDSDEDEIDELNININRHNRNSNDDRGNFREIAQLAAASEASSSRDNSNEAAPLLIPAEHSTNQVQVTESNPVSVPMRSSNEQKTATAPTTTAFGGDPTNSQKTEQDKFAHPAKHWVNLRPTSQQEKVIRSSDELVRKLSAGEIADPVVEPVVPLSLQTSDASVSSASELSYAKRLTPKKKAVVDKLREVRERQARLSVSPARQSKNAVPNNNNNNTMKNNKQYNSPSRSPAKTQSPSRTIIKPSPIRVSSNMFFPIKRSNNDDSSVSSYSIKSFSSTVSGSRRGGSLAEKVKRASSSSPMRYKPFEDGVKTNVSGDESMSVKKGLNVIHSQNKLLRNIEKKKSDESEGRPKSKQSFSRLNSNLARLKALKEEKRQRDEQLEKQRSNEESTAPKFHYVAQLEARRGRGKAKVADDEFTVDAEVLQINGGESQSGSSSEDQDIPQLPQNAADKKKDVDNQKPKHQSQWAVIMQNRLEEVSSDESSSFEDEYQDDEDWDADSPKNSRSGGDSLSKVESSGQSRPSKDDILNSPVESFKKSPIVKTPDRINIKEREPIKISPRLLNRKEENRNDPDEFVDPNFKPPVNQIIVTPKRGAGDTISKEEETLDQDQVPSLPDFQNVKNQVDRNHINGGINPYIGPFEHLLPRSSNPWIIRINPPTLSSSLTSFRSIQPPPIIPAYESNNVQQIQNAQEFTAHGTIPSGYIGGINVTHQPQYPGIGNVGQQWQYHDIGSFEQQMNQPSNSFGNVQEQVQYSSNGFTYTQNQQPLDSHHHNRQAIKPGSRGNKSLAFSNSTESVELTNRKPKKSSEEASTLIGEASTLIGQEHVPSNDSESLSKEESLSRWWENNYAASQEKDLNDMIKQALSKMDEHVKSLKSPIPSKDNSTYNQDSDDDVFSGLESPHDLPITRKPKKASIENQVDTLLSIKEDNEEKKSAAKGLDISQKEQKDNSKSSSAKQQNQEDKEEEKHSGEKHQNQEKKEQVFPKDTAKAETSYNFVTVGSSDSLSQDDSDKSKKKKTPSQPTELKENVEEEIPSIGRVSSRLAGRGGSLLNAYTCGILEPMSSSKNLPFQRKRGKENSRRHLRDDDTYDDNGTYYTNDNTAFSSRSGSVGSQTNGSRTYDSRLHLSEKERKVWDAWDRKDNEASPAGASKNDTSLAPKGKKELHEERCSRAHEKLLMHAYIALSKPPPEVVGEKGDAQGPYAEQQHSISNNYPQAPGPFPNTLENGGEFWQPNDQQPFNVNQGHIQAPNYNQAQGMNPNMSLDNQFSDTENQAPHSFATHENISFQPSVRNEVQDNASLPSNNMQQSIGSHAPSKVVTTPIVRKQKSLAYQKHVLEKFCVRIKHAGVEVLKLNREKKWQTRYLTVSKEGTWLKNGNKGDSCFCPLGLLWVKKFSRSKEHSVLTIDKQGKGGMLLANLVQVKIQDDYGRSSTLTKKQLEKYHDSLIIHLHAESSFVTFRCERNDADAILVGCNAIIDVLRGNNTRKLMRPRNEPVRNKGPSLPGSVANSNPGSGGGTPFASNAISKTYVANDLWEA